MSIQRTAPTIKATFWGLRASITMFLRPHIADIHTLNHDVLKRVTVTRKSLPVPAIFPNPNRLTITAQETFLNSHLHRQTILLMSHNSCTTSHDRTSCSRPLCTSAPPINGQQDHLLEEENVNKNKFYPKLVQLLFFLEKRSELQVAKEMEKAEIKWEKARMKMEVAEKEVENAMTEMENADIEVEKAKMKMEMAKAKIYIEKPQIELEKAEKETENVGKEMEKAEIEWEKAIIKMKVAKKEVENAFTEMGNADREVEKTKAKMKMEMAKVKIDMEKKAEKETENVRKERERLEKEMAIKEKEIKMLMENYLTMKKWILNHQTPPQNLSPSS